ncbi:uncharacterized protein LOC144627355 isoform X1 [Crassostrea virginica]
MSDLGVPNCLYAVVEFLDENSVSVVHQTWIKGTGELIITAAVEQWVRALAPQAEQTNRLINTTCYWPPTSKNISQRVKKGELPDKDRWGTYPIRTFYQTDDFERAVQYCKKAQETSNVESDIDMTARARKKPDRLISDSEEVNTEESETRLKLVKRVQKRQRDFESSSSTEDEAEHEPLTKIVLPKAPIYVAPREGAPQQNTTSPGPSTSKHQEQDLTPKRGRREETATTPRQDKCTCTGNCHTVIVQKLNALEGDVRAIKTAITQIAATGGVGGINSAIAEDLIPNPLNTMNEMKEIIEKMKDETYKKKLVQYFMSQGGYSPSNCIRRMMRKLGTNALWAKFSLKGQKGKESFSDHPVCRIIMKSCVRVFPSTKVAEMEEILIDFLKQAPHKPGGPKYKKPAGKCRRSLSQEDLESE